MKKLISLSVFTTIALAFTACGGSHDDSGIDPITAMYDSMQRADSLRMWGPPKEITFADAMDTAASSDGIRVTIEGYITVGSSIYESSGSTTLELWERKGQLQGNYISVRVDIGSGNNEMSSLPNDYAKSDLKLKDDKGNEVVSGDRVRITGIYDVPWSFGKYGSIDIQSFEKVEDVAIDYTKLGATKITTDTNGRGALKGKLVYAEGILEIPMFVSVTETCYFDLKPSAASDEYIFCDILIGKGPNMVEEIPDNFSQSDIKIHDNKDQLVGKKKVRVYGVWDYERIGVEYIEIIE